MQIGIGPEEEEDFDDYVHRMTFFGLGLGLGYIMVCDVTLVHVQV